MAYLIQFIHDRGNLARVIAEIQDDLDNDGMGDDWERRVAGDLQTIRDKVLDLDSDGLKNLDEFRWDTDPFDPDSDDDSLMDGPEAAYWDRTADPLFTVSTGLALQDADSKTDSDGDGLVNIHDPDSDNDLLADGEEYYGTYSNNVRTFLEFADSENSGTGDGLTDYQEVRGRNAQRGVADGGYGTLPMDTDSDDDAVTDGEEASRWGEAWNTMFDCDATSNNLRDADSDGDRLNDGVEWDTHGTDPASADTDGDTMDDAYEVRKGFLPASSLDGSNDVDGDGLTSAFEYAFGKSSGYQVCAAGPYLWGFDPQVPDMDGDSLTDGAELDGRHNPYSSPSHYAAYPKSTDAKHSDSDFDSLGDSHEMLALGTNPNDADTDGDGLADGDEAAFGTSPTDADSDNDGLNDGGEQREGTNPNLGDSDGDGAQDGSDSNPRQENIPPSYPGGPSAYVVFREDGYIDVIIEEPNSEEANVAGVQLSGTLTASGPSGSLPSLSFNMEATRGDDGIWGARVGIPPGVSSVTHESIRLLVVDNNGVGWATTGSFGNTLAGPTWDTSPESVKSANDWQTLIEHQSPVNTDPPAAGASMGTAQLVPGPDGTTLYDPEGPIGALAIYRVDPLAFAPVQDIGTPFGEQAVAIAEDGFVWVDPAIEPGLYEQTAFGFKWKAPKYLFSGIQGRTREFLNSAYKTTESALRETQYQSASFILGSDHPAAHGRSSGDFVGGFLLWGDFRDCIVRPAYINPQTDAQKIIDAAITALSCTGLAVDLAQATPGAPAAVAANAAMTLIKLALKKLVRVAAELGVHLVDMIEICARNLDTCLPIGAIAKVAKDDDVARTGLKELVDAVGAEDLARFEKRFPNYSGRLANLQKDFVTRGVPDYTLVMRRSHVGLNGWDADTTLSKILTKYDMAVKTDPARAPQFLADVSKIIEKSAQGKISPAEVQNFIQFGTKEGDNVVQGALKQGDFLEARYATELLDKGTSIDKFAKSYTGETADFYKAGKKTHSAPVDGEYDLLVNSPSGKVRVEVKDKANLDSGDFTQIEKQLAHQKARLGGGHANEYDLVLGKLQREALPTTLGTIEQMAKDYAIKVKVLDRVSGLTHTYGP
ncbi:MAG TPA: hypothetical protein VM327_09775 [Candidatus Thermoplasmatota archaeon]|nr:hypothetical protein [Candidatus Thermoplasmatota archaeon]